MTAAHRPLRVKFILPALTEATEPLLAAHQGPALPLLLGLARDLRRPPPIPTTTPDRSLDETCARSMFDDRRGPRAIRV